MAATYIFDAIILTQRMNSDWSVTDYTLTEGPVEIDPPGTRLGFTLTDFGIELADIDGGSFAYSTSAFGPVTDYMGNAHPASIQVLTHAGGVTTVLRIDRHVRALDDTLIGFDDIIIPISGAALPGFATAEAFADWFFALPWSDPTETYPAGTEFVWEDFDVDPAGPINGTSGADTLVGTTGDDSINGFGGADLLQGARGNDLISGAAGNDTLEAGEGLDTLYGGAGNDVLRGGLGNETDLIDGGDGIDTVDYTDLTMGFQLGGLTVNLNAGTTSGTFYVGQDQLVSIENADGTNGADRLIGSTGANLLRGLGGDDSLVGGAGNDSLDAGLGTDTMSGGAGDDIFITNGGDVITEQADQGIDTVRSSASLTLGANLEHLVLTGTASLNGVGNDLSNRMTGNGGANTLNGLGGHDTLSGGSGDDRLIGGGGADSLVGGPGNDTLFGGIGRDTLSGGTGADSFVFNSALSGATNVDTVSNFDSGDQIQLDQDVFTAIGFGLQAAEFKVIPTGTSFATVDASDRIIYLQSTGRLFHDADGSGADARVLFAQLEPGTALTLSDFLMI